MAIYFTPGMLVGLVLGWFIIRPVNVGARLVLPRLQPRLRYMTDAYGWTIGMSLR